MDFKGEEVLITLIPLGAPHEVPRTLTINETVKQVEVGRASRNADKCLVAAKDNAWFDSPIMSRQHAKFSTMAHKRACLQDNNSTHGTYLGNQRLDAHKDYPINNNEIITFGVRVTSGARTYLAKEFRVSLEWRPFSISVPNQTKPSDVGLRSTRFHVPDDAWIDSSSESSREASVQILDSHGRTYSVPSSEESDSDSDDEEDLSPLKEVRMSESTVKADVVVAQPPEIAGTTPHHPVEIGIEPPPSKELELARPCETRSFNSSSIKMNDSGASHPYPFDAAEAHQNVILSSDSEDELPEVLSSKQVQVRSSRYVPASSSTQAADSHCLPGGSPFVEGEADHVGPDWGTSNNHENPEKSMIGPQSTSPELQMDDSPLKQPTRKPLHEPESIDIEDFDYPGLYLPYSVQNPSTVAGYAFNSTACGNSSPAPGITFDAAEKSMPENSQTTGMNGIDSSRLAAYCKTTVRNNEKDSAHKASGTRRPPSPSDAALVKKAKFVDQRSFWPVMEETQSHTFIDNPSELQTQSKMAHGMGEANPTSSDFIKEGRYFDGFDPSWNFPCQQPIDRPQIHGSKTEPDTLSLLGTDSSKSAAQGRPLESASFSSCSQDSYTENCASSTLRFDPDPSIFAVVHHQPKENGSHSSRLNISDIVHPQLESTRNLKRKADEMSVDDTEAEPNEESHVLSSGSTQDILTDAQPRDITSADETVLLEDSSKSPPEVTITVQQSLSSESPEPPRKKVKTSVSTAIGIGKFVSGVCFGVVGVFAAFIATIPLSVQEEAIQELVSSA